MALKLLAVLNYVLVESETEAVLLLVMAVLPNLGTKLYSSGLLGGVIKHRNSDGVIKKWDECPALFPGNCSVVPFDFIVGMQPEFLLLTKPGGDCFLFIRKGNRTQDAGFPACDFAGRVVDIECRVLRSRRV